MNAQVNSGFFYSSADQREKLVAAERKFTDDRVRAVIALKNKVGFHHGPLFCKCEQAISICFRFVCLMA